MFKKNRFLVFSILAHAILIYIIAQPAMFSSRPKPKPPETLPIQARIIFDVAPVSVVEKPPVEEPLPVSAEKPSVDVNAQLVVDSKDVEKIIEAEVPPPAAPEPEPILDTPSVEAAPPTKPEKAETTNEPAPETAETQSQSSQAVVNSPVTSMARRHLGSFQQQQHQRMAEQASRQFQESKNAPFINTKEKDPFMTEDEKLQESLKVRADCGGTTKATAALLLGYMGGNIECTQPPEIDGFIQKRLNKTQDLPRQSATQKSQSALSKSIVVQDK
ncbi:hypothetical protein [Paraglaciecola sp. 2405UD69-4]|uniref:hypothetical protein n=1 Tax=Paraglaciecola sp. 2405UD69-4 TaxID=3391836 RepID=UPI0039C9B7FC